MKSKALHTKRFARLFLFTALILALIATPALADYDDVPWFEQAVVTASGAGHAGIDVIGAGSSLRIFVSATNTNLVQIYGYDAGSAYELKDDSDGWLAPGNGFSGPRGLAVTADASSIKSLFVADTGNHRILKFTETGALTDAFTYTAQAGSGTSGSDCASTATLQLSNPYDIAIYNATDPADSRLYVADTYNNRIVVLDLNLNLQSCWDSSTGLNINKPRGIAYGVFSSSVYVSDTFNHRVLELSTSGVQTDSLGSSATLQNPSGLAVDSSGFVYVADTDNSRMYKIDFVNDPARMGRAWTTTPGMPDPNTFLTPMDVAAQTENRIFVADTGRHRVLAFEIEVPPDAAFLNGSDVGVSIEETGIPNTIVGVLSATDSNARQTSFSYALNDDQPLDVCDSTHNSKFNISGSNLRVQSFLDYETDFEAAEPHDYRICVRVNDGVAGTYGGPGYLYKPFLITLTDKATDSPEVVSNGSTSPGIFNFYEFTTDTRYDYEAGTILGSAPTLRVYDNDPADTITGYAITGGTFKDAFEIVPVGTKTDPNEYTIQTVGEAYKTLLNYEAYIPPTGTLIVQFTDSSGAITNYTITINLQDRNDLPDFTIPATPYTIAENTATATNVGDPITLTDEDPSGTNGTVYLHVMGEYVDAAMTVDPTGSYFALYRPNTSTRTYNVRTTTTTLDYEKYNEYWLLLRACSQSNSTCSYGYTEEVLHITVTDLAEAPVLVTTYNLYDTTTVGSALNLTTAPPDVGDSHTFTINSGNNDGFFTDADGQIRLAKAVTFDPEQPQVFTLNVTVVDEQGNEDTETIVITVVAGNRPPVFVTSPAPVLTIPENTTSGTIEVGRISASDPDGNDITITTDATDPNNPFTITTTTEAPWQGIVYVDPAKAALLNYEDTARFPNHKYTLTATVSDGEFDVDGDFQVSITNINEAISITNKDLTITRGDRTPVGTVIGTIQWDDVDGKPATTPTFALSGDGANQFGINSSGQIYILPTASLHYYLDFSYTPTITITDKVGGDATTDTDTVPITLTDDNDPPTFIAKNFSIAENSINGTAVGSFQAFDENGQDFNVVVNDPASAFNITAGTQSTSTQNGVVIITRNYNVTVKDSTKLNYEILNHTLPLVLRGTEAGVTTPLSRDYTYNIALTNVNEPPSIANQSLMTYQNVPGLTIIGKLVANDPDEGTVFTFLPIAGGTGDALFEILSNGDVRVKSVAKPQEGTYTLFSKVRDNGTPQLTSAAQATITITVTKLADPALESVTLPAAELLTGTTTQYKVTVKNKDVGKSSPYSVNLKLPGNMNFVTGGSSAGCKYITADTVGCPAPAALNPMGTSGDTASFVINAAILADMPNGATRTATASLALDDPLNDNVATNNSKTVTFTARRAIVLTNQTFETGVPVALTKNGTPITTVTQTPTCATTPRKFLGLFSNDEVKYLKQNLINHNYVEVSFDLYLAYSWEGLNNTYGPDRWKFTLDNRAATVDTTFSNISALDSNKLPVYPQSFPDTFASGLRNPAFTGASQVGTLGYYTKVNCGGEKQDSVYSFRFIFDHTDPQVLLDFIAQGLTKDARDWQPEQWGLDNLKVTISGVKTFNVFLPSLTRP